MLNQVMENGPERTDDRLNAAGAFAVTREKTGIEQIASMEPKMTSEKQSDEWVYVYIVKSGTEESFLGLYDQDKDVNFIPAFSSKDDANDCFLTIPREKGKKYEVQAVHIEELHQEAKKNDFQVTMVDGDGKIIKEVAQSGN